MAKRTSCSARQIPTLLRVEIKRSGKSQYRIAADTGIKQPSLSKFLKGGSLRMETAATLLDYLGFRVVPASAAQNRFDSRPHRGKGRKRTGQRNRHNRH